MNVSFATPKMFSAHDERESGAWIDMTYCCGPSQVLAVNSSIVSSITPLLAFGCHQKVHRAAFQPSNVVPEIEIRWYCRYLPEAFAFACSFLASRSGAFTAQVDMLTSSLPGPEVGLMSVFKPGVITHDCGPASRNPASVPAWLAVT